MGTELLKKTLLIYMGQGESGHRYGYYDDRVPLDEMKTAITRKKMGLHNIGGIIEVEEEIDEKNNSTFSFNKKTRAIRYEVCEVVQGWIVKEQVWKSEKALNRENNKDQFQELIKPIIEASKTMSRPQRRALLAEILSRML